MKTNIYIFLSYLAQLFVEWEMFQTKIVEHIEYHAVYEVILKNIVVPDRPQMTVWRMRLACWIPKTSSTYNM
jgi:hypothetical protein